jgi:hypothetical protein
MSPDDWKEESATRSSGTKWSEEVKFPFPIDSTAGSVYVRSTGGSSVLSRKRSVTPRTSS